MQHNRKTQHLTIAYNYMTRKLYLIAVFFIVTMNAFSQLPYNLKQSVLDKIYKGEIIIMKEKIANAPWPNVIVYSLVNATSLESVAVFSAYEEHKDYIPDLLVSKIVKVISKTDVHIAFKLNIPWPLSNSNYIMGNKLSKKKNGAYQVKWYFVKSDSSKDNYGKIVLTPYKDKTIMKYENFTYPKSSLAKLFKTKMIKKVKETVIAIKKKIEDIKGSNNNTIKFYITALKLKLDNQLK